MKPLVVLFSLALLSTAAAQPQPLSKTINLYNKATKEPIGTVTKSGNRLYYRNPQGEHVATVVINADGTRSSYDANGKPIEAAK